MSKVKVIRIVDEIINLEEVAYVTKRTAQKSQEDTTPVDVVTVLLKSGSPINMPFKDKHTADYVHNRIASELGAVTVKIPGLTKK